jgi:hypothetical protein
MTKMILGIVPDVYFEHIPVGCELKIIKHSSADHVFALWNIAEKKAVGWGFKYNFIPTIMKDMSDRTRIVSPK